MPRRALILFMIPLLSGISASGIAGPTQETYTVAGGDMGPLNNHVKVWDSSLVSIPDAVVTVNGTPMPWTGSMYSVDLGAPIPEGDSITLVVEIGDSTIIGRDIIPVAPLITGPADGADFGPLDPVTVTWTSSADPDYYEVNIFCPDGCVQQEWIVPGDQRSFEIPAGELPVNVGIRLRVYAYNDGEFTGPADPDSEMNIRAARGPQPTVTVTDTTPAERASWGRLKTSYE